MILYLHRQGLSVSARARRLDLDRKTVPKYVEGTRATNLMAACATVDEDRSVLGYYDFENPEKFHPIEDLDDLYTQLGDAGTLTDILAVGH